MDAEKTVHLDKTVDQAVDEVKTYLMHKRTAVKPADRNRFDKKVKEVADAMATEHRPPAVSLVD